MNSNLDLVKTTVSIGGKQVLFVNLELHQEFYKHHHCKILMDHNAFGDIKWMADPVKAFKLIGESLSINMTHLESGATNTFIGLVSNVSFVGKEGVENYILLEGVSETIRLAGKPNMDSFVNMALDDIVSEAVKNSGNGATVTTQSEYTKPIYYIEQSRESCFDFLNRLCSLYGESFWCDGTSIYFGKPELGETLPLYYEIEMTDVSLKGSLQPPKFKFHDYVIDDDQEWKKESRKEVPEAPGYLQPILDKADEIYTSDVNYHLDALVGDSDSILKMVDIERTRTVANMLTLSGRTQTCKIGIGKVVTVEYPAYMEISTSAGAFIINQISHYIGQQDQYYNTFSGVRAALGYVPMPNVPTPIATPQRATVLSNADPENKGRIKVQYSWQKLIGKETNWIRVQTPDAGGSDKVSSNRGLVTIPEEGDTVMINYEYGDPNRPYSSGSLFTSKTGGGGGQGNKNKSLTTRSGSTFTLDDSSGSAKIKDKHGSDSQIVLDGDKNITIDADTSLTINIGKGSAIFKMDSGGNIYLTAKSSIIATVSGEGGTTYLYMTPTEARLTAETNVCIDSKFVDVTGSSNATIKQNDTNKIQISGLVDIDGSQVQIN